MLFYPTNKMLLIFIGKKKLKTDNAHKQLKKSQNIFKILWCIANENINIQ